MVISAMNADADGGQSHKDASSGSGSPGRDTLQSPERLSREVGKRR